MKLNQYLTNDEIKVILFIVITVLLGFSYRYISQTRSEFAEADALEQAIAVPAEVRYDINTVTAAELMTLSGIGEVRAQAIIDYRHDNKPISLDEVINIHGIGPKTLESMREYFYADND